MEYGPTFIIRLRLSIVRMPRLFLSPRRRPLASASSLTRLSVLTIEIEATS